jgi:hypothetical protein
MYNCIPMANGKIQLKKLTHGYQDCPLCFQNVMSKVVQDMEYFKTYLNDWKILTNRNKSFKGHQLKFKMILSRISTADMMVNAFMYQNLSSLQNK